MLQERFTKPAGKALAAGLMAAWLSTGAMASGPEQANNDNFQLQTVSLNVQTGDKLFELADSARKASLEETPKVGIYANVASDIPDAEVGESVEIIYWLLEEAGIKDQSVVLQGRSPGAVTTFTVFVAGFPKKYTFDNIEQGVFEAKHDLEQAVKVKRFEQEVGLTLSKN